MFLTSKLLLFVKFIIASAFLIKSIIASRQALKLNLRLQVVVLLLGKLLVEMLL